MNELDKLDKDLEEAVASVASAVSNTAAANAATEFKPKTVDLSIERFIENGERLYEKQLRLVSELRMKITRERANIVNDTHQKMIDLQNQSERTLYEFDQESATKMADAERMLRGLDALRRSR